MSKINETTYWKMMAELKSQQVYRLQKDKEELQSTLKFIKHEESDYIKWLEQKVEQLQEENLKLIKKEG